MRYYGAMHMRPSRWLVCMMPPPRDQGRAKERSQEAWVTLNACGTRNAAIEGAVGGSAQKFGPRNHVACAWRMTWRGGVCNGDEWLAVLD